VTNRISAQIIADSKNAQGDRITTYILNFPRIVLAEFNTHRMISKNSASSRAIPFKVILEKVKTEPFIPIAFQKEHKGMQGNEYLDDTKIPFAEMGWLTSRDYAVRAAQNLSDFGVTKQLCNRLLEPFLYHTVICTGTEWENFFALRAHPDAEIHIADLASKMLAAYNESTPKLLQAGEYHIPFGDSFDLVRINQMVGNEICSREDMSLCNELTQMMKVKIATARCARVSYLNFEGKDDYLADIKLHNMLWESGHMSPFEHCARAMSDDELIIANWSGNFKGFIQYRKTFVGENKSDPRVNKQ
jgi:thymidylate synthase ThyX